MSAKQVQAVLDKLLSAGMKGLKEAATAHWELAAVFNAWKAKPTADNWNDVVYRAQGALMWIDARTEQDT